MKNLLILFILAATLVSCSSDDTSVSSPEVVQKVVFYKNTPNQKQWNFSNGLLSSITLADGTVAEEFIYDNQKRLISDVKYTNGVETENNTITYNLDNTIKTINALPYSFDTATKTYTYSYGSTFTINCEVNADFLATNFVRTGTNAGVFHMNYANGNMTSFEKVASGSTEIVKNFSFGASSNNPIYSAVLAVAKVKSLTDPNFFIDGVVSAGMAEGFDNGSSDPYHYNYGAVSGDKLLEVGIEVLDSSNNFIDFYSFADYYYQ